MGRFMILFLVAAISGPLAWAEAPVPTPADGAAIYADKCQVCHGRKGNGKGVAALALKPAPTDFTSPAFWTIDVDERSRRAVRKGVAGTSMRAYTELEAAYVTAIVTYLGRFQPPPESAPPEAPEEVEK